MNYQLVIIHEVYEELNEAAVWYNDQQAGLGFELLDEWENTLSSLFTNPLGYEKKYKYFRQIELKRFPYLIIFEVLNNQIVVYHFISSKRSLKKRYLKRK